MSGDMFFKYRFIKKFAVFAELYVYPDIKKVNKFNVDFTNILGEVITKRHIIEDPFEFCSIRDYCPVDSLRTINWKATAKTGDVKVNQFNFTSSQKVMILLDFDSYNTYDRVEIKEDLIRIASFLTHNLIKNGIEVGLISNGCDIITGKEIFAPYRNGIIQENKIFRLYARINEKLNPPAMLGRME
jgi:uncharacterized protein (DUF58 family)